MVSSFNSKYLPEGRFDSIFVTPDLRPVPSTGVFIRLERSSCVWLYISFFVAAPVLFLVLVELRPSISLSFCYDSYYASLMMLEMDIVLF